MIETVAQQEGNQCENAQLGSLRSLSLRSPVRLPPSSSSDAPLDHRGRGGAAWTSSAGGFATPVDGSMEPATGWPTERRIPTWRTMYSPIESVRF
jgi:hypothetical protein